MNNPLKQLREYILSYCHFEDESIVRPLALWIAGTYIFDAFDAYPYLTITAKTKRSGKTRLGAELISFTCSTPMNVAGASPAALFRAVKDMKPTIIQDEAEQLNSEAASLMRQFLNVGYRKGQTIPRADGKHGIIQWPTYCPKVFILIGDVYDTLKDRSIVVNMKRLPEGKELKPFSYERAKMEGNEIGEEIKSLLAGNLEKILKAYETENIKFLTDRDAEIWRSIFALERILGDGGTKTLSNLTRTAVDVSTEKTLPSRSYAMSADAEKQAERESYARRLLADMLTITKGKKAISSLDAIKELKKLDTAPWRVYRAESDDVAGASSLTNDGLDQRSMSTLLAIVGLRPKPIRNAVTDNSKKGKKYNGKGQNVARGYARKDIEAAAKQGGVK